MLLASRERVSRWSNALGENYQKSAHNLKECRKMSAETKGRLNERDTLASKPISSTLRILTSWGLERKTFSHNRSMISIGVALVL